jgi:tripartite-type tricarboxylate transporter receptor subunit TctC
MTEFGSVAVSNSPDALARMLREETEQWAALVKEIGLNTQNAKLGR